MAEAVEFFRIRAASEATDELVALLLFIVVYMYCCLILVRLIQSSELQGLRERDYVPIRELSRT